MSANVSYDSLDAVHTDSEQVLVVFRSGRFGYVQVEADRSRMRTLPDEPNLQMFSGEDLLLMEKYARIIWRMVFDVPADERPFA